MRVTFVMSLVAAALSGCASGAYNGPAGLEGVASMIESVGSTATGFKAAKSTVELNGANKDLLEAQTAMMRMQVAQREDNQNRLGRERVVTTKLLRDMSRTYHDTIFETLADWVEAGGDPDFAFKYALSHVDQQGQTKVIPEPTLSLGQQPQVTQADPSPSTRSPASAAPPAQKPRAAETTKAPKFQPQSPLHQQGFDAK